MKSQPTRIEKKINNRKKERKMLGLKGAAYSRSSAGGMLLKSKPSSGNSEVSGPNIPSELRVNPLCKSKKVKWLINK